MNPALKSGIGFLLLSGLTGCFERSYQVEAFQFDELTFFRPYSSIDTVIYLSERNEADTLVFEGIKGSSDSTRGFSQGYSNTNYLTIKYTFTPGSYHQASVMSDGKHLYEQRYAMVNKTSDGFGSMELNFIGTIFGDSLRNIQKLNDSLFFFDSKRADYSGMSVNEEIRDFTFHTKHGVTEFTDARGLKWKRK